jgi:type II/III secretion system protein
MTRIALLLLLAMPCLHGQDPEQVVRRVFQLKYAEPNRVRQMLQGARTINFDDQMKTLAIEAQKSIMDEFEQIIKRLDVPPPPIPNVEITIYLMSALAQPSTTPLPSELEGVAKQLKNTFSYKGFELIDTQVIRTRAGKGGEASGVIDRGTGGVKAVNQVKFNEATVSSDEKGRVIHLRFLKVGLRVPVQTNFGPGPPAANYLDTGISTDVDVREGQKVVVGKANMDGSDRASIVVLMAKVVD